MAHIPVLLQLQNTRPCLIVGGGNVATRKAAWLLNHHLQVVAIAPEFSDEINTLARENTALVLRNKAYARGDLSGYAIVIAATDNHDVNQMVAEDARAAGVLVNIADDPQGSDFYLSSTVKRGDVEISIHTSGNTPAMAARLSQEMEEALPEWFGLYAEALGHIRQKVKEELTDITKRREIFKHLASRMVEEKVATVAKFGRDAIEHLLWSEAFSMMPNPDKKIDEKP